MTPVPSRLVTRNGRPSTKKPYKHYMTVEKIAILHRHLLERVPRPIFAIGFRLLGLHNAKLSWFSVNGTNGSTR